MHPLNLTLILLNLKFIDSFTRINFSLPNHHTSLIWSVVTEYLLSKLNNYNLKIDISFTLVGKTKHIPDQSDSVICSLFANFFQQQNYSIINVLPNINSVRLNPNLTSNLNHLSCFTLPTHDVVLSLMTSLKTNSPLDPIPLNLLGSLSPYFIGLITEIIHRYLISYIVPHSMIYSYLISN